MQSYKGLTDEQVVNSRKLNGENKVDIYIKQTFWQKYWLSFNDPIINILLISLTINVIFTIMGKVDWFEAAGIFAAVLVSTFVGNFSEYRNERVFQTMQTRAQKIMCKVYRNGTLVEVAMNEIVCHDYILLQAGDMVAADGVLISGDVALDQSALNGENKEAEKTAVSRNHIDCNGDVDFWDKHKLYKGSTVVRGEGVMIAKSVGVATIYGKMEREIQIDNRESPLMIKLSGLAKSISRFAYVAGGALATMFVVRCIFVANNFDINLIRIYFMDAAKVLSDLTEAVILGIVVIVMSVPEGLPLMIAIVCSLNMKKMLKDNILIKKLVGIETAGSINILFCDKTGTITKGQLEVINFVDGNLTAYEDAKKIPVNLAKILALSVLGNCSALYSDENVIGGNSTERSLLGYLKNFDIDKLKFSVIRRSPFDSEKKFSFSEINGEYCVTLIKGAPEKIINNCKFYYNTRGERVIFNAAQCLERVVNKMAKKSMRLIAFATADSKPKSGQLSHDMTLVGLIALRDDIRSEVKQAIEDVTSAGVQVVMITGDKRETAEAIANEVKILKNSQDVILTSEDLSKMSDDEVKYKLINLKVVARALPGDKNRLVRLAQELNLVVGMTGDGVNDSPALKRADVGFAMGSGSEVAKEAGDIVILDDNFASIRKAILYGRTIYNSIKKFITFQLTINVAAVSVSLMASLFGLKKPLDIIQMLWINLIMDTLAAIAFGSEPALKKYLVEKPKRRDENIISNNMWSAIFINGLFVCAVSMILLLSQFGRNLFRNSDICFYTGYFCFFIFTCIFNAFNTRVDGLDLIENIAGNKRFLLIMFSIGIIQYFMAHYGGNWLHTAGLTFGEWITVVSLAILIIPVDMLRKKCLTLNIKWRNIKKRKLICVNSIHRL